MWDGLITVASKFFMRKKIAVVKQAFQKFDKASMVVEIGFDSCY